MSKKEQVIQELNRVISLIHTDIQAISPAEKKQMVEETVEHFNHYVSPGWLAYRKSVSSDSEAGAVLEWQDEGAYCYGLNGEQFIDCLGGFGIYTCGHRNPEILDVVKAQLDHQALHSQELLDPLRGYLAKAMADITPGELQYCFFTNGGADANENAIKMARMYTGRKKVFSRYRSYHGSTFGAGNLTGEPRRYPLEPGIPGFVKFFDPYMYRDNLPFASEKEYSEYYVNKLREQVVYEGPDTVAAIVMETITGSNGIIIPPEGYLAGVRRICDEFGIMMICDEVMAGFGRTGKMFAFENFGVKPDIVSFAKGVTCGYVQLGGVAVSRKIADYFDDNVLQCGLTYSGHPLACAAGVACLNYYKDNDILGNVNKSGKVLGEILEELKAKHKCVGDVRYIGLFSAVELVKDKATREPLVPYGGDKLGVMGGIIGKLKAKKFMTYSHENMILVCPPLIITPEQLREEMVKLDEVLAEVDATL